MPIAVLIGVRGSDVDSGTQAEEHGLNGPLELREEDVVGGDSLTVALVAVDTDQRETNTLDVDVVDLGVHEDVVDVQLHVRDLLGGINDRASGEDGSHRDVSGNGSDTNGSSGTLGSTDSGVLLNGKAREAVAGGNEDDVVLVLNVNRDETLTIGNRDRGNREAGVAVEPEDHILVYPLAYIAR